MAVYKLLLPRMGESITEATLIEYHVSVGDTIEEDDIIAEVATDKVDSEVPSPVTGKVLELPHSKDDVVQVGEVLALIEIDGDDAPSTIPAEKPKAVKVETPAATTSTPVETTNTAAQHSHDDTLTNQHVSPLVRTICREEGIPLSELDHITGTGLNGRITKSDILAYIANKGNKTTATPAPTPSQPAKSKPAPAAKVATPITTSGNTEIVEMDRMRKMIADHMVHSKHTAPHVSTFLEVDVTNIVDWRKKNKDAFQAKYGEKLTFTPIFFEAIVKAIKDYPEINSSINGDQVIIKKDINLGMAAALPSGNLIVPVIKNADHKSLVGLTKDVNDLAARARANKLKPAEIQDGTFTVSNIGTFGNDAGTPIINQPQSAILALGAIKKKPAVVETEIGDVIAIRQRMILSISFDHRIIDGFLGGSFLRRVGDYIEQFDPNTKI